MDETTVIDCHFPSLSRSGKGTTLDRDEERKNSLEGCDRRHDAHGSFKIGREIDNHAQESRFIVGTVEEVERG
eukprot:scaffold133767_cov50-Attheya_sp.AAC.3